MAATLSQILKDLLAGLWREKREERGERGEEREERERREGRERGSMEAQNGNTNCLDYLKYLVLVNTDCSHLRELQKCIQNNIYSETIQIRKCTATKR